MKTTAGEGFVCAVLSNKDCQICFVVKTLRTAKDYDGTPEDMPGDAAAGALALCIASALDGRLRALLQGLCERHTQSTLSTICATLEANGRNAKEVLGSLGIIVERTGVH